MLAKKRINTGSRRSHGRHSQTDTLHARGNEYQVNRGKSQVMQNLTTNTASTPIKDIQTIALKLLVQRY